MMFNKHGQTLILFVILIPILLGLAALVIDMGLMISTKAHLKEVTKMAIKENVDNLENSNNRIEKTLIKNKIDVDNLKIEIKDNKINVKNEIKIDSIFGSIIGIKEYKIKIDIAGYKENDKIIIE